MPEVHAARRERVQAKIAAMDADAALITSLVNVRYLTGLASSNAALLLTVSGQGLLATDSRYTLALPFQRTNQTASGRWKPEILRAATKSGVSVLLM